MKTQARIDFDKVLNQWDGFGVNYVETAQTRDYEKDAQEYGGFSTLSEEKRQEIIDLTFGEDGLKPGVVKMFLDPFHQKAKGNGTVAHYSRVPPGYGRRSPRGSWMWRRGARRVRG